MNNICKIAGLAFALVLSAGFIACDSDSGTSAKNDESSSSVVEESSSSSVAESSSGVASNLSSDVVQSSSSSVVQSSSSHVIPDSDRESSSSMANGSSVESSSSNVQSCSSAMSSSSVASSSSSVELSACVIDVVDPSTVVKGTMTDSRDGQTYRTVTIGCQTWMAENLNYAYTDVKYDYDGFTSDSSSWCYNNEADSCAKYGRLYTWAAAMDSAGIVDASGAGKGCGWKRQCNPSGTVRGVCPEGWHLPNDDEWNTLFTAVGGGSSAGTKLKSTSGWNSSGDGTDVFDFSVLPAGFYYGYDDYFRQVGEFTGFWSSTECGSYDACHVYFDYKKEGAYVHYYDKYGSFPVRCIKD